MSKGNFLYYSKNAEKDSYIWNMLGSVLYAFQSVIMLMAITRYASLYDAGLFTFAYANANMFLNIGKFGMRNYQVSDVKEKYSFYEYNASRWITTFTMMLVSVVYICIASRINNYNSEKSLIIFWVCLFKAVDAIEDVFHGLYQQKNRLDIAGKCMTFRMISTVLFFVFSISWFENLYLSLVVSTVFTIIVLVATILLTYNLFVLDNELNKVFKIKNIRGLLTNCFSLFLGYFLSFYIVNAPKYSIDRMLNEEAQAVYGFISMPVSVVVLLSGFVFNPIIINWSYMWNEKEIKELKKSITKQLIIVVFITVICEFGAFICGIPVLNILYNTELSDYKTELLLLLVGGGLSAGAYIFMTFLIIVRKQMFVAMGYIIVSVCAAFISGILVKCYGITGAVFTYLFLMMAQLILFGIPVFYLLSRNKT